MVDQAAMSEEGMARRGLKALYLETPEAVARDLEALVCAAFDYLHRQLREVRDERDLKQAECSANSYAHSEARTLIADQSAALALAREALKFGVSRFSELDRHDPTDWIDDDGSTVWGVVAHLSKRFVTRARTALTTINAALGRKEP